MSNATYWQRAIILALFGIFGESASACPKIFQKFNVPKSGIEKDELSMSENAFGPALKGLKIKQTNGAEIFFHPELKAWCLASADKSPDCKTLNSNGAGELGSGNNLTVENSDGKVVAFLVRDGSTLILQSTDLTKPWSAENPRRAVDRRKPQVHISATIEEGADGKITSKLAIEAFDEASQKILGKQGHEVSGTKGDAGKIDRPTMRAIFRPDKTKEAKASNVISLVGTSYEGPRKCGYGSITEYAIETEKPAASGHTPK